MGIVNCHSLLRDLNLLCKFLDSTYNINNGGCCFLASIIAERLDKIGIKYDLVIYDSIEKDESSIEYEVTFRHKNKTCSHSITGENTCNHYCLYLEGAGIINGENKRDHQYRLTDISYKSIKWIYKNGIWNDEYNIQHNKTIKSIVKAFFREYEKFSIL